MTPYRRASKLPTQLLAYPKTRMVITICSTKGGVGKTTLTANLGSFLAHADYRVLMVDADIQPTLSSYYPLDVRASSGLYDVVTVGKTADAAISRTNVANLDIVVSDDPDGSLENWILHTPDGRIRLRRALADLDYDFILIDTQGAIGPLQDLGVLASDILLSPIPPEILSAREFARGTLGMLDRLRPMQHLGAPISHLYGLCYRMDRTVDARIVADTLRKSTFAESRGSISILNTIVPATVVYREAASARVPVHGYERRRRSESCTPAAFETMAALVRELLPHVAIDDRLDGA